MKKANLLVKLISSMMFIILLVIFARSVTASMKAGGESIFVKRGAFIGILMYILLFLPGFASSPLARMGVCNILPDETKCEWAKNLQYVLLFVYLLIWVAYPIMLLGGGTVVKTYTMMAIAIPYLAVVIPLQLHINKKLA